MTPVKRLAGLRNRKTPALEIRHMPRIRLVSPDSSPITIDVRQVRHVADWMLYAGDDASLIPASRIELDDGRAVTVMGTYIDTQAAILARLQSLLKHALKAA